MAKSRKTVVAVLVLAVASVVQAQGTAIGDSVPVVCSIKASQENLDKGMDIVTDASCQRGDQGCVDTACRACKHWDSEQYRELRNCSDFMAPTGETTSLRLETVATHGDSGLDEIAAASSGNAVAVSVGAGVMAVAVAAMAFAANKFAKSQRARKAPQAWSPSGSLVYRRASVFHI